MPNESLIHADIFFFISTIALTLISIGILIALYYGIRIFKNVREITDKINRESTEVLSDIKRMRHALRDEGLKWMHVIGLIRGFFMGKEKTQKTTPKKPREQKEPISVLKK